MGRERCERYVMCIKNTISWFQGWLNIYKILGCLLFFTFMWYCGWKVPLICLYICIYVYIYMYIYKKYIHNQSYQHRLNTLGSSQKHLEEARYSMQWGWCYECLGENILYIYIYICVYICTHGLYIIVYAIWDVYTYTSYRYNRIWYTIYFTI